MSPSPASAPSATDAPPAAGLPGGPPNESQNASGPAPSGPGAQLPATPPDSGPALCGADHTYKIASGEERTKPCIKAKGHSGPHSSRAQNERVDLSVLASVALEAEDVPGDDTELLDEVIVRERSEQQLAVDKAVKEAHGKWVKAGKPKGINEAIKKNAASRYRVAPEQVAAVRKMLQLAESAPDNKGLHVKRPPARKHADGTMMQYFIVVDKQPKSATPPAATPPATAPPATAPPAASAPRPPATPGPRK